MARQVLEGQPAGMPAGGLADQLRGKPASPRARMPAGKNDTVKTRQGTRERPYVRGRDGVATVKAAFICTFDFNERLRRYALELPPTTNRNDWIERVLTAAMDEGRM